MDDEQDALYKQLRQFVGTTTYYKHRTGLLVYTDGVEFLAERARVQWLIDLIAGLQPLTLEDSALCEFQLWELHVRHGRGLLVCLRDCDDVAFRYDAGLVDSALDYIRLYLESGVLMLPSEH